MVLDTNSTHVAPSPEMRAVPKIRLLMVVQVGSRGGLLASLPLSLSYNTVCILYLPCSQMTDISDCILGMNIDLDPTLGRK